MHIECVREKLRTATSTADKVTGKNLSLPILNMVLFIAKGSTLKIRATNLDIGIEITVPVKIHKEGIVVLSGSLLSNILSHLQDDSVVLYLENTSLILKTKNSSTTLNTFPYEDFPTLPSINTKNSFSVDIEKFTEGLRSVWYSATQSDIKPEIASVYVCSTPEGYVFAATDSFRLAEKKILYKNNNSQFSFLIPCKNVAELLKIFNESKGEADIMFDKSQIVITCGDKYTTSRINEGIFPDYKQILPKEHITEVVVLRQELMNALKLTQLFSDQSNFITLSVSPSKKLFEISSKKNEIGENTMRIDAALSGDSLSLSFNHRYILDCLQSISKDSISICFSGKNNSPVVFKGVGDKSFFSLVMPINN
jgi:DNA polymerase III subunit beta